MRVELTTISPVTIRSIWHNSSHPAFQGHSRSSGPTRIDLTSDFLLTFRSKYHGPISYCFRDNLQLQSKIANYITPVYLTYILNSQHAETGATWRINANILSTCRGRTGGGIVSPRAQLVFTIADDVEDTLFKSILRNAQHVL